MDGVLVIDKPSGPTSHDVVAWVRRVTGIRRIGHTGTLDPLATGVLPLVVGKATRLASYLSAGRKTYEALVRLGLSTTTYDAEGDPLPSDGPPARAIERRAIEQVLDRFRGRFRQTPPAFSAKKVAGTRAHELARGQTDVQLTPVEVEVHELDLLSVDVPDVRLRVVTGPGFYVRSLAHEIGGALGCGAHLAALRRTRSGDFTLEQAVPASRIEALASAPPASLIPMPRLLTRLPGLVLTEEGARRASHGNTLRPADIARWEGPAGAPAEPAAERELRLLDHAGELLGLARPGPDATLRPIVVLR